MAKASVRAVRSRTHALPQSIRPKFASQRRARHAKDARRRTLIEIRELHRELDCLALDVAQTTTVRRNANLSERCRQSWRLIGTTTRRDAQLIRTDDSTRRTTARFCGVEHLAQFAHVARPAICAQCGAGVETKLTARCTVDAARISEVLLGDETNIVLAVAQRRQLDAKNREARQKIFAERTSGDAIFKARLTRCDHATMDCRVSAAVETRHAILFERSQKTILQCDRQLTDFGEIHRAAAGKLQQAELARTFTMVRQIAEQLDFKDRSGDRRTVDRNERGDRMQTCVVNASGNQRLAGSSFAAQQERAQRGRGDATRHVQGVPHAGAIAHDSGEWIAGLRRRALELERSWLHSAMDHHCAISHGSTRGWVTAFAYEYRHVSHQSSLWVSSCGLRCTGKRDAENCESFTDASESTGIDIQTDTIDQVYECIGRAPQ